MTKRKTVKLIIAAAAMLAAALPARYAGASDETADTTIKIKAPLEATSCGTTPPTITVLGLTIDISAAAIDTGDAAAPTAAPTPAATPVPGDDGAHGSHGSVTGAPPSGCYYYCSPVSPVPTPSGCSTLVVGETVEVTLASDATPLAATQVEHSGSSDVAIEAPIQSMDATAQTLTVLGLSIDVSGVHIDGADDDSSDGNSQPVDFSQLLAGQFVELKLAGAQPPLAATSVEIKNFANQVEVELEDQAGGDVDDVDTNGDPVDDVDVEVTSMTVTQPGTAGAAGSSARVVKVLHLHSAANGSFLLSGLPHGHARVFVVRTHGAAVTVARRALSVKGNATRTIRLRLRPAHH